MPDVVDIDQHHTSWSIASCRLRLLSINTTHLVEAEVGKLRMDERRTECRNLVTVQ